MAEDFWYVAWRLFADVTRKCYTLCNQRRGKQHPGVPQHRFRDKNSPSVSTFAAVILQTSQEKKLTTMALRQKWSSKSLGMNWTKKLPVMGKLCIKGERFQLLIMPFIILFCRISPPPPSCSLCQLLPSSISENKHLEMRKVLREQRCDLLHSALDYQWHASHAPN